jgi:hypothetical protein
MSLWGRVSQVPYEGRDGGRPSELGNQVLISSHRKPLSKAVRCQHVLDRISGVRKGGFLAHLANQGAKLRQKSGAPKTPNKSSETFGGRRGSLIRLKIRLGSYSMDFAANTALPNCAGARGSPKPFIIAGRRNS